MTNNLLTVSSSDAFDTMHTTLSHTSEATRANAMDLGLIAAFQSLQLDPANDEQTVAFEALCWKHVLHQTSSYWLRQVQTGTLPPVREVRIGGPPRRTIYIYDHTLNRLTFEFVENYAGVLWPSADDKRSHLTTNANVNFKLKAVKLHTRLAATSQARLERDLGHPCTEHTIVAESMLGCRVREFLKELVRTRAAPPVDGYSAEQALKTVLESARATASMTPRHPPTTHNLTHEVIDLRTPAPLTESVPPADTCTSVPTTTSERVASHWTDTQAGTTSPISFGVSVESPRQADVISLSGSDSEEDSGAEGSGLLCSHAGCQLRFPDWTSFEIHAQLPHNNIPRVSNSNGISTTNAVRDSDDLHEAMDSSV